MDERGDVSWTPIYLMVIVAIAAILLFAVIKPMFASGAQYAEHQLPSIILPLL